MQTVEPVKEKETDADCRASKGVGDCMMQTVEPVKVKETDADCRASRGEGLFSESLSICRQHAESNNVRRRV